MKKILIKNARLVNEGETLERDLFIEEGRIVKIDQNLSQRDSETTLIDAAGAFVLPGIIDDQVHFREPVLLIKVTSTVNHAPQLRVASPLILSSQTLNPLPLL